MRRIGTLAVILLMGLSGAGCIVIASERSYGGRTHGNKRLVEIDGEIYVVNIEEGTAKKLPDFGGANVTVETEK